MTAAIHQEPADFYMLWTKTGWPPRKQHTGIDEAFAEATRLAEMFPGKKFIVLHAVGKVSAGGGNDDPKS